MAARGSAPLAVCLCNNSHCANQQHACLPQTIRCYQMPLRLHEASADPTTGLGANSKAPPRAVASASATPPTGDPLKERPTATSVTCQVNAPNYMDHPVYRNFVDSPEPGFPVPSRQVERIQCQTRPGVGNRLIPQKRASTLRSGADCQVDCQPLGLTPLQSDAGEQTQDIYLRRWTTTDDAGRAGKS